MKPIHTTRLLWVLPLFLSIAHPGEVEKAEAAKKAASPPVADKGGKGDEKGKKPAAPGKKKEESKEGKHVEVKKEDFEIEVELDGVVESRNNLPIRVIPEAWSELIIEEVVPHGTAVKKGDVLIRLETEKLEESIAEKEAALPLSRLRLEEARADLEKLKKSVPLELEETRRSKSEREEDLVYFEDVRRPMEERDAREDLKSYRDYLEYAEEELRQLKKMYENDDVTEETEEIILKRAQNTVDRNRWQLEQAEQRTNRRLNTSIPREHELLEHGLEVSRLNWRTAEKKAPRTLELKQREVEEQERSLEKEEEALGELKTDLKGLVVRAPRDGIVYYGANRRGKWITAATVEKKLIPGGRPGAREILMTLVDPADLQLTVDVPENRLADLKKGLKGTASMKWNEDLELGTSLQSISHVPQTGNTFPAVFSLNAKGVDQPVLPGMNAKVKVEAYSLKDALIVPKSAVQKEGGKSFVIRKGGGKQVVKTGKSDKDRIVILEGLAEGDLIEAGDAAPEKKDSDAEKK